MARQVFFSFHFQNDVMRAAQVRNSNVIVSQIVDAYGFIDSAQWESVKRGTDNSIKRWIDNQLHGTSVTVVLIGSQTVNADRSVRKWIKYEIDASIKRGNGILGVYIHKCSDPRRGLDYKGLSPFDVLHFSNTKQMLNTKYRTYDWIDNFGRTNLGAWIEQAALDAGRR